MLAKAFVVVFVTLSSVLISVESYSSGAPDGACKTMMPVHVSYKDNSTFPAETSPAPFVVLLSAYNATSPPPPNVTSITKFNNPQPINGQLRFVFINRSGILIKKFSYRKFKGWQYDVWRVHASSTVGSRSGRYRRNFSSIEQFEPFTWLSRRHEGKTRLTICVLLLAIKKFYGL